MIRQDYIMRMIEQLVKVLSKILFNKNAGSYQEAINNVDTAFKNILGLDFNLLNALSAKDIISLLEIAKDNSSINIKCIVIAKLLKERADIENISNKEAVNSSYDYQRVLGLFLEGILNNKNKDISLSDYYADVNDTIKKLRDRISDETRFKLFQYYELSGEYDKAEKELLILRDMDFPDISDEGIKFYRKLLKLSDEDLRKGNLSRDETTQGLTNFLKG